MPVKDSIELSEEAVSYLSQCTGFFIAGGDTRKYHRVYANLEIATIIRERYQSGVPFGGVSAGALISTEKCTVWGGKVTTPKNEYFIKARPYFDPAKDGDVQLSVGEGLGLLGDCVVEAHFSEHGGFPRLVQSMELTKSTYGLGIDEPICLEIQDETLVKVHGEGRAYILKRLGSLKFEVQVLEHGDKFEMCSSG
ncbi:MAG: Type 1 glutamine amidotransferase-like domain-containing protein [Candidatus Bathyarchaeota archaeon]|nr:Type 1 glutamine amidotransferase-like domain-containing protein [Candidatus Bathyarchaeota archaeon]